MMDLILPMKIFGAELNRVQSPSRYLGGEFGATVKKHYDGEDFFNAAIAFPDLYEIAMSNLAVKIIYNGLNEISGIRCERVFAPDVDFENLLKEKNVPLFTLETGMKLCDLDLLCFSIGYELGLTEVLAMLDDGGIPISADERSEGDPIVIAGGCGVTNPAPFADFFDAIMVGEAENELFEMVGCLNQMKKKGSSRSEMISFMETKNFIWTKKSCVPFGKKIARRAVQPDFGLVPSVPSFFPIASIKPVQDHGVVEIMRGCPNGCRFCHAGIYYRPMRVKNTDVIIAETDRLVFDAGYREISLNSLSSADFPGVENLLDTLNERYKGYNVSFQLPSLKVNSLSLDVLEKISAVRKSGLTFAVETPEEMWQLSLNKEVYSSHLEEIIVEAKKRGWSSAKFYFMIGLPVGDYFSDAESVPVGAEGSEEKAIVDFLVSLQKKTRIQCNVNVGIFIPKPHTAYQWMKQISPQKASEKIEWIFQNLPRGKFRMGRHNYDATVLEGLLSRGGFSAGKIVLDAYRKGCRFDAWDEHLKQNFKFWQESFAENGFDVEKQIFSPRNSDETLPWDGISLGVSKNFFRSEWEKSVKSILTQKCSENCTHRCGICNHKEKVSVHTRDEIERASLCIKKDTVPAVKIHPESNIPVLYRAVFDFTRKDGGEFTAYLAQVEVFHKAILRTKLPFVFTTGFNPLPRLEFASAMTLGIPSMQETASCYLYDEISAEEFMQKMNGSLPEIFRLTECMIFPVTNLRKRESLSKNLWGAEYGYSFLSAADGEKFMQSVPVASFLSENPEFSAEKISEKGYRIMAPVSDKNFRGILEEFFSKKWYEIVQIEKIATLSRPEIDGWTAADEEKWRCDNKNFTRSAEKIVFSDRPVPYLELYAQIAKVNRDLMETKSHVDRLKKIAEGTD